MSADLHLVGVCGTYMGGLALVAKDLGLRVEGSDRAFYPPISRQLEEAGVRCHAGYDAAAADRPADTYVIGNAISRGNPLLESVMREGARYTSGPQWLFERVLRGREVVAVSGTHGKTTVTSMVAEILERAGRAPGFLVGGIPAGFGVSARLGTGECFVVEADEYDTAFFDKRPKFMHCRPRVAVLNNLEFDHADIYPDLGAIRTQFSYLLRTVPDDGTVVANAGDPEVMAVVKAGWTGKVVTFGDGGEVGLAEGPDGWRVSVGGARPGIPVPGHILGRIHRLDALAAVSAAMAVGVGAEDALGALSSYRFPARRLELVADWAGRPVYDDFAHHPTAIEATLETVREIHPGRSVVAVLDARSNTMKSGHWNDRLAKAFGDASVVAHQHPDLRWDASSALSALGPRLRVTAEPGEIPGISGELAGPDGVVVLMSNGDTRELRRLFAAKAAGAPGATPAAVAAQVSEVA